MWKQFMRFVSWILGNKPEPKLVREDDRVSDELVSGFIHPATITHSLALMGMYKDKVIFSCTPARRWHEGSESGCHGEVHLYVKRNGKWEGGKFDHIRNSTVDRDFNNIRYKDYQIWKTLKPVTGEPVAMILINYAQTERTNAVFGQWK